MHQVGASCCASLYRTLYEFDMFSYSMLTVVSKHPPTNTPVPNTLHALTLTPCLPLAPISQAEARIKETEQQVRFISQNLDKEICKFDAERRRDYREFMIRHVHSQIEHARQESLVWEALRDQLR